MTTIAVTNLTGKLLLSAIGENFPFPKFYLFDIASTLGITVMVALLLAKKLWIYYCAAVGEFIVILFCNLSSDWSGIDREEVKE